jgi:hypothetical protein
MDRQVSGKLREVTFLGHTIDRADQNHLKELAIKAYTESGSVDMTIAWIMAMDQLMAKRFNNTSNQSNK